MIYTEMTKKAMKLSYKAHENQTDRDGMPYVFHPYHLAEQMGDEITVSVALLHDVIEDTDYTMEDIRREGFPDEVCDALMLLTHDRSVPYMEYIETVSKNKTAARVKLADLIHNSDLSRRERITQEDRERTEKYRKAIEYIKTVIGE